MKLTYCGYIPPEFCIQQIIFLPLWMIKGKTKHEKGKEKSNKNTTINICLKKGLTLFNLYIKKKQNLKQHGPNNQN